MRSARRPRSSEEGQSSTVSAGMPQNNHHNGRTAALARELRDRAASEEVAALPNVTCKMNMVSGGILQRAEGPPLKFNKHLDGGIDLFDARQRTSPPLQRAIAAKQTSPSAGARAAPARCLPGRTARRSNPASRPSRCSPISTPTTRHPRPRRRIGAGARASPRLRRRSCRRWRRRLTRRGSSGGASSPRRSPPPSAATGLTSRAELLAARVMRPSAMSPPPPCVQRERPALFPYRV